jgi:peptide/nickel transport system substrate-binding protein
MEAVDYQEYFERQGIGRRQFLRMIAAVPAATTLLPVLTACGVGTPDESARAKAPGAAATPAGPATPAAAPTAAAGAPQRGGTIIIATLGEAQTINPLLSNEVEGTWRARMLFDEFVKLDLETLLPQPNIAREWKILNDGTEYTFALRDDVRFSDGAPLTAHDIAFTLHAILKKETASPYLPRFLPIKGAKDYNEGQASTIGGVQVVDDHTLKLTLAEPSAALLSDLRLVRPLPRHLLDGKDLRDDPFFQNPVGAGPFVFKSWSTGQDFVAERNPYYWQQGKPYLDSFTHRVIPDSQTIVIALETGQVDSSEYALPTQADELKARSHLVVLVRPQGVDVNGWAFSQKNNPALKDVRVRRAIAMAIDTQRFASDFLLGLGKPASSPIPPTSWAAQKDLKPLPYDPGAAKQLLQEAGVTDLKLRAATNAGNRLREDWLTFTQQSLAEVGVTVQPDIKEWSQVVKEATDGTFEMLCPTFAPADTEPDELYLALHSGSPRNVYGYANPEMDRLLEEGRRTTDIEKRKLVYARVQELIVQDVPIFYAWDRPFIRVTTNKFAGYQNTLLYFYEHLEDWYQV